MRAAASNMPSGGAIARNAGNGQTENSDNSGGGRNERYGHRGFGNACQRGN